jgi:acyl-CoA synthetase (AMP-forming)/AMP-acid ligase II
MALATIIKRTACSQDKKEDEIMLSPWEGIIIETRGGVPLRMYKDRPRSLGQVLEETVRRVPQREAIICESTRWNYQELNQRVNDLATSLARKLGIQKGDRVSLLQGNSAEWPVSFLALSRLGAISVPLNTRFKSEELKFMIQDSGSKAVIFDPEFAAMIDEIKKDLSSVRHFVLTGTDKSPGIHSFDELLQEKGNPPFVNVDEEDLNSIFYTSGTTGRPKGAMMSHRNIIQVIISVSRVIGIPEGVKQLICIPLFHVTGCNAQLLVGVYLGGTSVIMKAYKSDDAMALIEKEKIELIVGVPTMYWLMLNSPNFKKFDLSSLKSTTYGGAPAPPELLRQMKENFPQARLGNGFGMTETSSLVSFLTDEYTLIKPDSVGPAIPVAEIRVVNEHGKDVPTGEAGEIIIRSPNVVQGYWDNPQATKDAIVDGWLHSGDVGKLDEEGFLYVVDRMKDMIIRGGENIYCVEVENALYAHPKVLEAAVIGVKDKFFGEQVKTVVVLKPGEKTTEEEIKEFCAQHIADYKVPKYVEFLNEPLPRNPGGKVIKTDLKKKYGG